MAGSKIARYSAENEECSLQPLLQPASSYGDLRSEDLQQRRSISLYNLTEDHQALTWRIPEKANTQAECEASTSEPRHGLLTDASPTNFNRQSQRLRKLNISLFEAVKHHETHQIDRLIQAGADPNATCGVDCVSVCHLAAMRTDDALFVLLNSGAEKQRLDRFGRTPLHLAAWAGNIRQIAVLLGLSRDLQNRLDAGDMTVLTEEELTMLSDDIKEWVNVKCDFGNSNAKHPTHWKNNNEQFEKNLPVFQMGWTALHAASARAQVRCARLLIAAGAVPCACDLVGRTPLDITGSAYYSDQNINPHNFTELVTILINANCNNFSIQDSKMPETPLHTAVELGNLEAVSLLASARVPVNWLNRAGQTALHLCVTKKLLDHLQILTSHGVTDVEISGVVDVTDKDGQTVLQKAILEAWEPGVRVAIEAGANITARDSKYETPLHLAAMTGNVDILNHILKAARRRDHIIDATNSKTETALFKAVVKGHLECVKRLLEEGASITKTLPRQINLFHIAAEKGHLEVLTTLLDHDLTKTRLMINCLADDQGGYGPIHFAVHNNNLTCVNILLSRNADRMLKTSLGEHKGSTPLHIAARYNRVEIAKTLIDSNKDTIHIINDMGWTPLHTASRFGNRDIIKLLLKKGADLSCYTNSPKKTTAIHMIMNHLLKPTEFMENIFDTYISTNDLSLQDANCKVSVDYSILKPGGREQMKVIVALLKTGNKYDQRRLFVHPLVESYLHIKWTDTLTMLLFLCLITFYYMFLLSFTLYILFVFASQDIKHYSPRYNWWAAFIFIVIILVVLQEILYMNLKCRYFYQIESWVRFFFVILALALLYTTTRELFDKSWPRHVATAVLLLSWLDMTFLQYHFHDYGYYVLMFEKFAASIAKIFLTFAYLVIAFALSFMLQFKFEEPFEDPFNALAKTIVMLFSELDYENVIKQYKSQEFAKSLHIVRIIFLVFLTFAAVVTTLVGVSVNDPQKIRSLVKIRIIKKRIEFLGSVELLLHNRLIRRIMPNWLDNILKARKRNFDRYILSPSVPKSQRAVPCSIRESICEIAESQKNQRKPIII